MISVVTPDGHRALFASWDHTLKVWDLDSGHELCTLRGHTGLIEDVAVGSNGRRAVSCPMDHTLKVWDLISGTIIAEFYCEGSLSACGYSDVLGSIITGDREGRIYIFRLEGMPQGDPITTAMEQKDGTLHLGCFSANPGLT